MNFDIKGKLERHVTGRLAISFGGDVDKIPLARAIYKGCDSKDEPPKSKHVRRIILETHNVQGGVTIFRELTKRPLLNSDVSCWKAMIIIHRVLMDGHQKVLKDSLYEINFIKELNGRHTKAHTAELSTSMLTAYSDFLVSKINFHNTHPDFNGNISLDNYLQTTNGRLPDDKECVEIVTHLLDHQDRALELEKCVLGSPGIISDNQISALIPLVLETYAIYSVVTYFLKQLVHRVSDQEVFDFFCQRYYAQYIDLREFYAKGNNIHSLARIVPIPMLPIDPPQFEPSGIVLEGATRKHRSRTRSGTRKQAQSPQSPAQMPIHQTQPAPQLVDFFAPTPAPTQPSPVQSPYNPFEEEFTRRRPATISAGTPPGWVAFSSEVTRPTFNPAPVTSPPGSGSAPIAALQKPEPVRRPSTQAASNSFFLQLMGLKQENNSAGEGQPGSVPTLPRSNTLAAPLSARVHSNKAEVNTPLSPSKTDDYLTYRRVEPKPEPQPIVQPQSDEISKLREEVASLKLRLEKAEAQNRDLVSVNAKLTADNQSLKSKLEHLIEDHEEERRQRMAKEMQGAYSAVDSYLFALDSPANVGNRNATAQILLASSKKLAEEIASLFAAMQSGKEDDIRAAVARVVAANKEFMDNAKGCTYLTENQDIQRALLSAARATGTTVAHLLRGFLQSINELEDWTNVKSLQKQQDVLREQMLLVETAADQLINERAPASTEPKEDLEAVAEQELLKAAKIIEEAAKQLSSFKAQPRPPQPAGKLDVSGPIIDAAQAITEAAQYLIRAAADSQRERVEKGKLPNSANSYKVDPAWSEGLISAAKYVALATQQLVTASSKLVEGKLQDADLIAASKAVASATAQLVAASTAKADAFSKSQENLVKASGLVKRATDQLVAAARHAAAQAQEDDLASMDFTKLSHAEYKVKQVNQMAKILELEKEVNKQREILSRMRKAEYAIVNPYANLKGREYPETYVNQ